MLRKFGSVEILSVDGHRGSTRRVAHRAVFSYVPREGYLYVRSRAISSRCNDNFDMFPAEEIEKAWKTFVGKPVFVNHSNHDHRRARGVIIDAALHKDRNPNGSPDTWVEVLMEIDGKRFPKLAQALINGDIDRTSMGTDVKISKCSICGNEAESPLQYCRHIPGMKGKRIAVLDSNGGRTSKLVFEICSGLSFFENSLLVEPPADPTAFFLGNVMLGPGLEHLVKAAASQQRIQDALREDAAAPFARVASLQRTATRSSTGDVMTSPFASRIAAARQALAELQKQAADQEKKPGKAQQFFLDNPVDPQNLVTMFKQATPAQRAEGMDWYRHMHRTARMITGGRVDRRKKDVVGGDPALGAGLLANYSQQSSLSDNHWKASKTALAGKGLWAGNHPGFFAGQEQGRKADRMLAGEHHSTVLGAPKTRAFAHLIEHGGDDETGRTAVCVDRHALSAAVGHRITDADYASANLARPPTKKDEREGHSDNERYRMVADAYRHAASQLTDELGEHIAPHHVQAVTWVMQRDQNAEAEAHETDPNRIRLIKGRATTNRNETARWQAHVLEHYPSFADQQHWKMTTLRPRLPSRISYGETKAPSDVDTLRPEMCAICGNDLFDGRECSVCGWVAPPQGLGDPDVTKARQLDQLKDSVDEALDQVDPSRPGAPFDAGDTDQLAPGGDNTANPWLQCDNCGTALRPVAPQTTGQEQDAPLAGPAAGDACPVCEQGQLLPTDESEDDTGAADDDAADEDEDEDDRPTKKPPTDPASRKGTTGKYRHLVKETRMQAALRAMAQQQELVEHLARENFKLQRRMSAKDSQIQRLTAGLTVLARHAGVEVETMVRSAMLRKQADEQNPAQPVPEPAPAPATESTMETKTPEAFADVRIPGMVPGTNQDVPADAVTTAYTPGQDIASPPVRNLVDVTAPVDGAQGPRPLRETKTEVDVRVGNPMNPQVAFPLDGDFANAQRTSSLGDERFVASLRLARMRIAANIEQGDDLEIAQKISRDASYSQQRINQEIQTLDQVTKAAALSQRPTPPRGAVPRPAQMPRLVPSLASTASVQASPDEDLDAVFIGAF